MNEWQLAKENRIMCLGKKKTEKGWGLSEVLKNSSLQYIYSQNLSTIKKIFS